MTPINDRSSDLSLTALEVMRLLVHIFIWLRWVLVIIL